MAATTSGNAQWGVKFTCSGITGVLTDCESSVEPIYAQQKNELGAVIKNVMYDKHETVNGTLEVAEGTELPDLPSQCTVAGVQGTITSARVVESNSAFKKYNVTIEKWSSADTMVAAT